ncbi:right-handed parallel beta-helix repeat-containing protein [Cerasicoccus maritimus]|uniref:right-handed parallel beta-helix repeat-containing protein n=1 Tax=Cerasicoccus maritimus TaxID=490089 RepID=UPI0028524E2A|nr:right-handed parallel beta-helix repeat-containing protein [Cerasicoccus maritimus]
MRKDPLAANAAYGVLRLRIPSLALLAGAALSIPSSLFAAQFDIAAETTDNEIYSDSTQKSWPYNSTVRTGNGNTTAGQQSTHVIPFALPTIPSGEEVTAASLSINLQGWHNYGANLTNIDVYGLETTQSSSSTLIAHYVDGANPSSNSDATLVSSDLLTPADIDTTAASSQTIAKTSGDFANFIQGLYDNGAQPGEYVFLVLTHDSTLSGQNYYLVSSGDASSYPVPELSITTSAIQPTTRTVTTTVHAEDRVMLADFTTRWVGDDDARVGHGYSASQSSAYVMPVQLPTLNAGESIQSAELTINLEAWNNYNNVLNDIDLFGIYVTNASPVVNDSDYFVDGANAGSYPLADLISDGLATPADINTTAGSGQTITKVSVDIGSFFQDLYDGGASAGDYAFLTISHDVSISLQRYYDFSTADSAEAPSVEFTIVTDAGDGLPDGPKLWVDDDAASGGDGSEATPYDTIQAAVNAAVAGDVIVVKDGTYTEQVDITQYYSSPITIIAEPGASPIVTGQDPLSGWTGPDANGVYTLDVADIVEHLYVRDKPMPMARWPKRNDPWLEVISFDESAETLTYADTLPPISGVTSDVGDLAIAMFTSYDARIEIFEPIAISGSNPVTVTFDSMTNNDPQYVYFYNHPDLISEPGEWAMERLANNETRLYFKPVNSADLNETTYTNRSRGFDISGSGTVGNVVVSGFIIKGFKYFGVFAYAGENITVEDCLIYNNAYEVWGNGVGGIGIYLKNCDVGPVNIRRCLITQNGTGLSLYNNNNVTIDMCEVVDNHNDGFFQQCANSSTPITGVTISNSYFHNHLYLAHPDNMQFALGPTTMTFDSVLAEIAGQNLMDRDGVDCVITNSVMIGSIARSIQMLEGDSWYMDKSTVGLSRYSAVALSSPGTHLQENIIYGNYTLESPTTPADFTADYNMFEFTHNWRHHILNYNNGVYYSYDTIAGLYAATGLEEHSQVANPLLTNVPVLIAEVVGFGLSTTSVLKLDGYPDTLSASFAVGDYVEINSDGVVRQITAMNTGNDTITISPTLPQTPYRHSVIYNWGSNSNFALDTLPASGSPALTAGPAGSVIGSTINVANYRAGDFDGDGTRDLPAIPTSLSETFPSYNEFDYPCAIPY